MRIIDFITSPELLFETNIINAGKDEISIKDADGNEIEHINSFDKIITTYLRADIFNDRSSENVKNWFNRNFYNWIKKGAQDLEDDMMDERNFQQTFYVPLAEYIKQVMSHEEELVKQKKLSPKIILQSFPDYVQQNPDDAVVFSAGRLFRLKKLTDKIQQLQDYIIAVDQNFEERNDVLMPTAFMVKRLDLLQVPEAFKRSNAWHRYLEQQAEKVSKEQAKELIKSLKPGKDFKVIEKLEDGAAMVQLLTAKAADVEGTVMDHCVASYGRDIEKGRSIIYSLRDKDAFPQATIELKDKKATQVKGPHNVTVRTAYHNMLRNWFKKHKISVGADSKHFGGMKDKEGQPG